MQVARAASGRLIELPSWLLWTAIGLVAAARCHPLACWGVDEASLPSSRTRNAVATWSTLAVSAMRCTVKSYHRKVVVNK